MVFVVKAFSVAYHAAIELGTSSHRPPPYHSAELNQYQIRQRSKSLSFDKAFGVVWKIVFNICIIEALSVLLMVAIRGVL